MAFCTDEAFARPAIYEALEHRDVAYAIRIPANRALASAFEDVRPNGRARQPTGGRMA